MGGYMSDDYLKPYPIKPCPVCGGEMVLVFMSKMKAFVFHHKNDNNKCYDYFKLPLSPQMLSLMEARHYWNVNCEKESNIIPVESTNIETKLLKKEELDALQRWLCRENRITR